MGLIIILSGCPSTSEPPNGSDKIAIVGSIIYNSTFGEDITINVIKNAVINGETSVMGSFVSDADVTINDIVIPYHDIWGYIDDGTLITLTPGNDYTVKVVYNGQTFEQTITMPPAPVITSHTDGAAWDESAETNLTWNLASTSHDENQILIFGFDTQSGHDYRITLPAVTTEYPIPAGTLVDGADFFNPAHIYVITRTKFTDFSSDYNSDSYILFTNQDMVSVDTSKI